MAKLISRRSIARESGTTCGVCSSTVPRTRWGILSRVDVVVSSVGIEFGHHLDRSGQRSCLNARCRYCDRNKCRVWGSQHADDNREHNSTAAISRKWLLVFYARNRVIRVAVPGVFELGRYPGRSTNMSGRANTYVAQPRRVSNICCQFGDRLRAFADGLSVSTIIVDVRWRSKTRCTFPSCSLRTERTRSMVWT
jgi:hypothetical protein